MLMHAGLGEHQTQAVGVSPLKFLDIGEYVDPVELLSVSDREALFDGLAMRQHGEDEEYQRWKDERD